VIFSLVQLCTSLVVTAALVVIVTIDIMVDIDELPIVIVDVLNVQC